MTVDRWTVTLRRADGTVVSSAEPFARKAGGRVEMGPEDDKTS